MRNLFPILVIAAIGYVGCVIWKNHTPVASPVAPVAPVAAPAPTATPAAEQAAAPVDMRNLAPDGTYYLVQRVSFETDSGVIGDAPGTKVTRVKAGPPLRVTDGQNEFEVSEDEITNDLDVAARVAYQDRAVQASMLAANAQAARQAANAEAAAQQSWRQQQQTALRAQQMAAPTLGAVPDPSTNALDEGPHPVNNSPTGIFKSAIH